MDTEQENESGDVQSECML